MPPPNHLIRTSDTAGYAPLSSYDQRNRYAKPLHEHTLFVSERQKMYVMIVGPRQHPHKLTLLDVIPPTTSWPLKPL